MRVVVAGFGFASGFEMNRDGRGERGAAFAPQELDKRGAFFPLGVESGTAQVWNA